MNNLASHVERFFPNLQQYLRERQDEFGLISSERRQELSQLAEFLRQKLQRQEDIHLVFICTHNSRRSQISQVWGQIAAWFYGLPSIQTYSGGTEVTAFNTRAVLALQRAGLRIEPAMPAGQNPHYFVTAGPELPGFECFSKTFDHPSNPATNFCAIMTCSQADEACPLVAGCELKLALRYDDPKLADDTPAEEARYTERTQQICRELLYAMGLV